MGSFTVVAWVGPVAVHLVLTGKLQGLQLVFHISLICRYKPGGDEVKPPLPIVVDEEEEYEVEALLAHRVQRGTRPYLVHWRGYDNKEDSWLSEIELEHS